MNKRREVNDKMIEGVQEAFRRLVISKRKNGEELVCGDENGRVVFVNANDVVLEEERLAPSL